MEQRKLAPACLHGRSFLHDHCDLNPRQREGCCSIPMVMASARPILSLLVSWECLRRRTPDVGFTPTTAAAAIGVTPRWSRSTPRLDSIEAGVLGFEHEVVVGFRPEQLHDLAAAAVAPCRVPDNRVEIRPPAAEVVVNVDARHPGTPRALLKALQRSRIGSARRKSARASGKANSLMTSTRSSATELVSGALPLRLLRFGRAPGARTDRRVFWLALIDSPSNSCRKIR